MSRLVFAWLGLPALTLAAALAWSSGCASEAQDGFVGNDDGSVSNPDTGSATCPDEEPTTGAACTQPEGTTCAVGTCGTTYVACTKGMWIESPPQPALFCPANPPIQGDSCPRCFPESVGCRYGCLGDAGFAPELAYCVATADGGLTWDVSALACPTFDAGITDADPEDGS